MRGLKGKICSFDFKKTYGKIGNGFIEVHHIMLLYESVEEVKVNPETYLQCVCSNCHRMLHKSRDEVIGIEDLIKLIHYK